MTLNGASARHAPPRHFLDLDAVPAAELRGIVDGSIALKRRRAAEGKAAQPKPLAGRTLAMIFDPDARVLRRRHARARRRNPDADGRRDAARPRRNHRGHGQGLVALRRRHRDPHAGTVAGRGTGAPRQRAGDQRAHQGVASLPGDGRRDDLRGAPRPDRRARRGLERRQQQRDGELGPCGAALRLRPAGGEPAGAGPEARAARLGAGQRRRHHRHPRPAGSGARRRRRRVRLLGVDGRRRECEPPQPAGALPGQRAADGPGGPQGPVHALPAGAPRRGGHRRGDRRPAVGGVRRGREPAPRPEGHPGLVPGRPGSGRGSAR